MPLRADTISFQNEIHLITGYAQFFHFLLFLLSKIVCYGVKKLKAKHVFRKIEIFRVCYIESSLSQKNKMLWTSVIYAVSRQCFQMCAVKNPISENPNFQILKLMFEVFLNFFHVYTTRCDGLKIEPTFHLCTV